MQGRTERISRLFVAGSAVALAAFALAMSFDAAHASATVRVTPSTVAPGGTITVKGAGFAAGVVIELDVRNGNDVRPFSTQQTPGFTVTGAAPSDVGRWQVCASGGPDFVCADFVVATPTTTVANTPPPTATPTAPPTAPPTAAAVDTTIADTTTTDATATSGAPLVVPPSTSPATLPPTTPPPTLPPGVDGRTTLDEPPSTAEGSGFSGMAIGGAIGIIVLAGLGVAGLLSSSVGSGPQPRGAIGVGIVGALLAGATLAVAPAPKLHVPKLAITRVQISQSLNRGGAPSTIEATCPTGSRAIGGGYTSDWSSWRLDDLQPMIDWMENPKEGNAVLSPSNAASISDPSTPAAEYMDVARVDRSVHYADQIHESAYNSWLSIEMSRRSSEAAQDDPDTPVIEAYTIPWNPVKAVAESHLYYRGVDTLLTGANPKLRTVGLLVSRSTATERSWQVVAAVPPSSLQTAATVNVVALCSPISSDSAPDGVPGVALRSQQAAANVNLTALCQTDEVLTAIGWDSARSNGVTRAFATGTNAATFMPSGAGGTETVTAVCVAGPGVAGTSATASTTVSGGFDGGATASCPSGYTATGGGMDLQLKSYKNGTLSVAHSVLGSAPIGTKGYGVQIRGLLRFQPEHPAPGSALFSARNGDVFVPLTAYANIDLTAVTVQALCLQRVLS